MKLLYFYQYFSTSKGSWGTRVHEFTREWVKRGHKVHVVSTVYYKSDLRANGFISRQIIDGVHVSVINVKLDNKQSIPIRVFTFFAYALIGSWFALTSRYDVAVASSGPITVGLPGLLAKYCRRKKLVFEVRDLWPQGAIEMGLIKNSLLQRSSYAFEKFCYRAADLIVTLSPGMSEEVQKKAQNRPVVTVTNSANIVLFRIPVQPDLERYGLSKGKYALYSGNIGRVNHVEWMYAAARQLQNAGSTLRIVFIGDGQLREALMEKARRESLTHLVFLPLMPKERLVGYVQQAMVALVPLADKPVLATSSPNKFFESLAAGTPVVQTTQGWMKSYLEEHDVGFTVSPKEPHSLSELLLSLEGQEVRLREMGKRASERATIDFDKDRLSFSMLKAITTYCGP